MSDATTEQTPEDAPAETAATVDWEAKYKGQQQVNRNLERDLNQVRKSQEEGVAALAQAFGVQPSRPGESPDISALATQVTELQKNFAETQHTNLVLSVANEHGISDKDALADLSAVKDEAALRRLAARLAQSNEQTSHTPKPDLTQGGKGGTGQGGTPAADFASFLGAQIGR